MLGMKSRVEELMEPEVGRKRCGELGLFKAFTKVKGMLQSK